MLFAHNSLDLSHRSFPLLIDGALVPGAVPLDVVDPATGETIATVGAADEKQANAAVAAAEAAQRTWRDVPFDDRVAAVVRIIDALEDHLDDFATLLALETGKRIETALGMELDWAVRWLRHFATLRLDPDVIREDPDGRHVRHYEPVGVIAAIVPWNYPLFQALYKTVPALMAGNTVVLKASPTTPLHALYLAELLSEILPAGVVNVLADSGDVGPVLTSHPDVAMVTFTGSTATGRKVLENAGPTIKRTVLELGGNDAAIVLPDVDVTTVAMDIFAGSYTYAGQICVGIKRIFVHDSIYDEFCDVFARLAGSVKLGHPLDPDAGFGPIQNAKQFETVKGYLAVAHQDGTVIAGGSVEDRPGYFVAPTVVRDISDDSSLVASETFGPVRPILRYTDVDDAVRRANDTMYGLGNSVWSNDLEVAERIAERLESGTVWINTHVTGAPEVPFGGLKQSGIGTEFGIEGLKAFTENKVVFVPNRPPVARDLAAATEPFFRVP